MGRRGLLHARARRGVQRQRVIVYGGFEAPARGRRGRHHRPARGARLAMSGDLALRLRSLTQDYHDGRLNFASYRSMRAALLDSLVSGAMSAGNAAAAAAVAATQPRAG